MKVNTPVGLSPLVVESANKEQSISLAAGPVGANGMTITNTTLNPDATVRFQQGAGGTAQIQSDYNITQLLDPFVFVGPGNVNSYLQIKGNTADSLFEIGQVGSRTILRNPKETVNGGIQIYASTNSVQYLLAPRDKNASIQVMNSTFFAATRSAEFGLTETGVGYVKTNGGNEFNIGEDLISLGSGAGSNPIVNVSGLAGNGRVYDTRFNKPYNLISTFKTASNVLSAQETFSLTLQPGTYQLQSVARLEQDGNVQFGQGIECWIQRNVSPNLYRDYSEIHLMSTMMIVPSLGESNTPSFVSGTFEIPQEDTWFIYANPVGGSWNFGTIGSSWLEFQIVKVA